MATSGVDPHISVCGVEMKVCGSNHDPRTKIKTRLKNGKKLRVIHKLDEEQVRWIVQQKHNDEMSDTQIAKLVGVSARWVRELFSRYGHLQPKDITYPLKMGRPSNGLPGRREHSAVISCCKQNRRMAVRLETIIEEEIGIHISHNTIYRILKDEELVENQPKKAKQRKWVRYERRFSNSLWHTDFKQIYDGRWFVSYQDDASRMIMGFGVYNEPTSDHAIKVLEGAIKKYGKPAQILTDHGSQFYANEKKNSERGVAVFENKLIELGIKQVMARIKHPQTNGKLERFHSEIEQHLKSFEEESACNTVRGSKPGDHVGNPFHTMGITDPITRLVNWYNNLPHMSLKDGKETPIEAYKRKQAPKDITAKEMESHAYVKS